MIVVLEISSQLLNQNNFRKKIIYSQNKDTNTVPTDIRLSRVIGHSYEGLSYNINNNKSSFVYMDDENKNSIVIAGFMVNFYYEKKCTHRGLRGSFLRNLMELKDNSTIVESTPQRAKWNLLS